MDSFVDLFNESNANLDYITVGDLEIDGTLYLKSDSNQVKVGSSGTVTLNVQTTGSPRTLTVIDTGSNADFVMTKGNQTIDGNKTFNNNTTFNGTATFNDPVTINDATSAFGDVSFHGNVYVINHGTNSVTVGTSTTVQQNLTVDGNVNFGNDVGTFTCDPSATFNNLVTLNDVGGDVHIIDQGTNSLTVDPPTFFNTPVEIDTDTNQLVIGYSSGPHTAKINVQNPNFNRIYTVPNVANVDSSFVMTEGNQTINGNKTFTGTTSFNGSLTAPSFKATATSNQFTIQPNGSGNSITLTGSTPAANRTYTIPDAGANANFVMTESNQTINGNKKLTGSTTFEAATNPIILQPTGERYAAIITSALQTTGDRVYTIPDLGTSANFVFTEGTQTINGNKSFTAINLLQRTSGNITIKTVTSGDIIVQTPSTTGLLRLEVPVAIRCNTDSFRLNKGNGAYGTWYYFINDTTTDNVDKVVGFWVFQPGERMNIYSRVFAYGPSSGDLAYFERIMTGFCDQATGNCSVVSTAAPQTIRAGSLGTATMVFVANANTIELRADSNVNQTVQWRGHAQFIYSGSG